MLTSEHDDTEPVDLCADRWRNIVSEDLSVLLGIDQYFVYTNFEDLDFAKFEACQKGFLDCPSIYIYVLYLNLL